MSWPNKQTKLGVGLLTVFSLGGLSGCVIAPANSIPMAVSPQPVILQPAAVLTPVAMPMMPASMAGYVPYAQYPAAVPAVIFR